jgi:hypothetical protein
LPAAGASAPEPVDDRASAEHCVVQAATGRDPRTQTTLGCFETFAAAQQAAASSGSGGSLSSGALTAESSQALAAPMAAGSVILGWHFEHHNGGGASVVIVGSSCSSTWYPSSWWRSHVSSTIVGSSCSGAKHYSLASCSGTYQIANLPFNTPNNLIAVNDNVGCVKYQ